MVDGGGTIVISHRLPTDNDILTEYMNVRKD